MCVSVLSCVFYVCSFGEMLAFTLTAFLELMDHGIVSWDLISMSFIKQASKTRTTGLSVSKEAFLNLNSDFYSLKGVLLKMGMCISSEHALFQDLIECIFSIPQVHGLVYRSFALDKIFSRDDEWMLFVADLLRNQTCDCVYESLIHSLNQFVGCFLSEDGFVVNI